MGYNAEQKKIFIPNEEIREELENAIEGAGWEEVVNAVSASEDLLEATLHGDETAIASGIDSVHMDITSILQYNAVLLLISKGVRPFFISSTMHSRDLHKEEF